MINYLNNSIKDFFINFEGKDIHYKDSFGRNILHYSIIIGDDQLFFKYIDKIDIIDDIYGYSPLYYSMIYDKKDIFKLILNTNPNLVNENNFKFETIFYHSLSNEIDRFYSKYLLKTDIDFSFFNIINNPDAIQDESIFVKVFKTADSVLITDFLSKITSKDLENYLFKVDNFTGKNFLSSIFSSNIKDKLKLKIINCLFSNLDFINNKLYKKIDLFNNDLYGLSTLDYLLFHNSEYFISWFINYYIRLNYFIDLKYTKEYGSYLKPYININPEILIFYEIFLKKLVNNNLYLFEKFLSMLIKININYDTLENKKIFLNIILEVIEKGNVNYLTMFFNDKFLNNILLENEHIIIDKLVSKRNNDLIEIFLLNTTFLNWTILRFYKIVLSKFSIKIVTKFKFNKYKKFKVITIYLLLLLTLIITTFVGKILLSFYDKLINYILN